VSKVSKSRTQLPVTPAASFTPVLGGLLQEQSKAGPVKELKHQPQPLSNTPLLIQRKLAVGEPDDKYEQEAERIAALVTQKPVVPVNPAPVAARANDKNTDTPPIVQEVLRTPGQPLDAGTRAYMEPRFGHDFSRVRVHTDARAAESALALNALAYTAGNNVVLGGGQYNLNHTAGQRLLAHELAHVIQQDERQSSPIPALVSEKVPYRIQGSFFGSLWEGIKSVGRAIGGAISNAAEWVGERLRDVGMWAINLLRDLPARLARLGQAVLDGLSGIVSFIPEAIRVLATGGISAFAGWLWERAKAGGFWVLRLVSRVFDAVGGPELVELITHLVTRATQLTSRERGAAQFVLGPNAIRWDNVRVAEGGLLSIIFALNQGRAFATFHTINLPSSGAGSRSDLSVVVHELTHVYQYEKVGSLYLGQAIHAQATIGYEYGGAEGLNSDRAAGKHYRDYNREQQAQIAQDYYNHHISGEDTTAYEPFIAELRAGQL